MQNQFNGERETISTNEQVDNLRQENELGDKPHIYTRVDFKMSHGLKCKHKNWKLLEIKM